MLSQEIKRRLSHSVDQWEESTGNQQAAAVFRVCLEPTWDGKVNLSAMGLNSLPENFLELLGEALKELNISNNANITNLPGLQFCKGLMTLNVNATGITSLDISPLDALKTLYASDIQTLTVDGLETSKIAYVNFQNSHVESRFNADQLTELSELLRVVNIPPATDFHFLDESPPTAPPSELWEIIAAIEDVVPEGINEQINSINNAAWKEQASQRKLVIKTLVGKVFGDISPTEAQQLVESLPQLLRPLPPMGADEEIALCGFILNKAIAKCPPEFLKEVEVPGKVCHAWYKGDGGRNPSPDDMIKIARFIDLHWGESDTHYQVEETMFYTDDVDRISEFKKQLQREQ